jgi:dephospho-CoA kinase
MPFKVGLTGGIGSGKSIVARIFEVLGVPVYYADEEARKLYTSDPSLKEQIIAHFGTASYVEGQLDRKYIADIVFNDKAKLELLNSLVHPATIRNAENWLKAQTTPYAIKEAALIYESGSQRDLDLVIGVFAPASVRIQRVMARDKVSEDEVRKRMGNQLEDRILRRLCDLTIENDDRQLVIPQVLEIHQHILSRIP